MKTGIIATKNVTSEDLEATKSIMGMSAKGMEMAQYFLRDKIYNDKILAVVREYICNAYDEHIKYNIQEDVDVQIVKEDNQYTWKVRDYALGLNENDIRSIFAMYFESTKSETNNAIGGFGVGGKAAFSYTDTFYVTSHHNGTKTNYVCTLGGGKQGIPVGEIYKLSEEPTTEQGIEVSLDVSSDYWKFSDKTVFFVSTFLPNAKIKFSNHNGVVYTPDTPTHTKTINNFTFNVYDDYKGNRPNEYTSHFVIRMGGVVYPHTQTTKKNRRPVNTIVVDVPIGKLSIPISRESIENTPNNQKVFEEIESALDIIENEECANLTTPKFGALLTGFSKYGTDFVGDWFKINFEKAFPKSKKWYYYVSRNSINIPTQKDSNLIYIIPDIQNTNNWHKRIKMGLQAIQQSAYEGYLSISKVHYEYIMADLDSSIDISDCVFVDVKKLKLPKLPTTPKGSKQDTKYLVYSGWNKCSYTPTELNVLTTNKYFGGVEPDDDWYDQTDSLEMLFTRTIGLVKEHGTRNSFKTVNTIKMVNEMEELGWITPSSDEYQRNYKRLQEIELLRRERDRRKNELNNLLFNIRFTDRVLSAVCKDPSKIDKIRAVKNSFLTEDSTRGRILKMLDNSYSQVLTRNDLRKIIKMK